MAFFVLEILVIFVCTLPRDRGYHCKIDRFLHMRTSFFRRRVGGVLQLPGVPHLHVNKPFISSWSDRQRANIPAHAQGIHGWHLYAEQSSLSISNETPKSCIDSTSLTEETWKRSNIFFYSSSIHAFKNLITMCAPAKMEFFHVRVVKNP